MADTRTYRWVSFDVYSALFDYAGTLEPELGAACDTLDAAQVTSLLGLWRRQQLALAMQHAMLERGHLLFREATRLSLDYALKRFDVALSVPTRDMLVQAWDGLAPWPEAPKVLKQLRRRGYRLALLSNGDQDMLEALASRLPGGMDAVLSAQHAGAYKPQPGIYRFALQELAIGNDALLHVAGSAGDVMGARAAGLACAWSNRFGDHLLDERFAPQYPMGDLQGLLEILPDRRPASAASYRSPGRA